MKKIPLDLQNLIIIKPIKYYISDFILTILTVSNNLSYLCIIQTGVTKIESIIITFRI